MGHHNSINNLSDYELSKLAENKLKFKAERSDIKKFINERNLRKGSKLYSIGFLFYIYSLYNYEPLTKIMFSKYLKQYFTYKRTKKMRGFLLYDLKEDILEIYNYEKQKIKITRSFKTTDE